MAKIAKILPIPKTPSANKKSTANSLLEKGYHRQPGATLRIMPVKLPDGRFLTNLDENAPHVLKIKDDIIRKAEQETIKEKRKRLEDATGLQLGPKSPYYSEMLKRGPEEGGVAQMCVLQDKENIFNFDDPFQELTFLWASLHPYIAPSLEDYKKGNAKPSCQFYVCNPEAEAKLIYDENRIKDKCITSLGDASLDKRKMVARLLGLPISENDKEEIVYNQLHDFITSGEVKAGEYKGYRAVTLFNQIMELKDNALTTKDLIKQALTYGVYKKKNKAVFEGDNSIAEDEDALLKLLMSTKNQDDYLALEEKVNNKKGILPNSIN